jgi:cytochrome c oxidase subunit 3
MMFAGLTSGYIVRRAQGNWLHFELPPMFWYTTAIIVFSSLTMHWALRSAKKDELTQLKLAIGLTFICGCLFLYGQVMGWGQMVQQGVYLGGDQSNPSGSFVYLLAGLHGLHIVGGLIYLLVVLVNAFQFKVHSKNTTRISMCATYWHFVDILWVYLFFFMFYFR